LLTAVPAAEGRGWQQADDVPQRGFGFEDLVHPAAGRCGLVLPAGWPGGEIPLGHPAPLT
jgi:hypothetical protein